MKKINPLLLKRLALAIVCYVGFQSFANAGVLNTQFIDSVASTSGGWIPQLMKIGAGIGVSFWLIETIWEIKKQQLYTQPQALLMFALQRSIIFAVATTIFLKIDLYQNIASLFITPAQNLSGLGASTGGIPLDAGNVWHQYGDWLSTDYAKTSKDLGITNFGGHLTLFFYNGIYFISAVVISFEIIMLNLKFIMILNAGVIFAGCWSSGWVKEWWYKYVGALVGISLQVLVFCLIYKSFQASIKYNSLATIVNANDGSDLINIIGTAIAAISLHVIPAWVGGVFTGVAGGGSGSGIFKSMIKSAISAVSKASKVGSKVTGGGGSSGQNSGMNSNLAQQPQSNFGKNNV